MPQPQIQDYLFQQIKQKLSPDQSLVDVVAGLLFVSADSAYRRIRGETPLVLDEARILCDAFSVSLDQLLQSKPGTVTFTAFQVGAQGNSFHAYLDSIHAGLQVLKAAPQHELIYLTKDIPVFYNFLFRPLFAFRYFFWMKSIIQHPDFVSARFSMKLLDAATEEKGLRVAQLYSSIPSVEIWNTECINSTVSQVEYYREAGYFSRQDDVEEIYHSLNSLVEHTREQAEWGCKFLPGEKKESKKENYRFFYNRIVLGDNTLLSVAGGKKSMYLAYDVLNYLSTDDEQICHNVYDQLQMLMRRSTLLSKTSEKQRNIFFNILLKKLPTDKQN